MNVTLTSTYHDTDARLLYMFEDCIPKLRELYGDMSVVVSPLTHESAKRRLIELGVNVQSASENGRGYIYRKALEMGLSSRGEYIHYCDWDRILHWISRYSSELSRVLQGRLDCECLVLERTRGAHRSHHAPLYYSEVPVNRVLTYLLRLNRYRDFLSASFVASKEVVQTIVELSTEPGFGFYGEWPVIVFAKGYKVGFARVRGLEWETPDRFRKEIGVKGYGRWLRGFETSAEWKGRVRIADEIVAGALNAAGKLIHR